MDQEIIIADMMVNSSVTAALLIDEPGRFQPFTVRISNSVLTLTDLQLSGTGVQVFAPTARVFADRCDLQAVQLDVLSVHMNSSVFRVSQSQPAVQAILRPDILLDSWWSDCQFPGGSASVSVFAGVQLSCFTSSSIRFRVRVSINRCTFTNQTTTAFACTPAGGVCLCSLLFSDSTFVRNHSPQLGGAIRVDACPSQSLQMLGTMRFSENSAVFAGGAVYLGPGCSLSVSSIDGSSIGSYYFENNSVSDAAGLGGALYIVDDILTNDRSALVVARGNRAAFGSVLATYSGSGYAIKWNCSVTDYSAGNPPLHQCSLLLIGAQSWIHRNLSQLTFCEGSTPVPPGQPGSDISTYPAYLGLWQQGRGPIDVEMNPLRANAGFPIVFAVALLDAYLQPLAGFSTWLLQVKIDDDAHGAVSTVSDPSGFTYALSLGNGTVDNFIVRYHLLGTKRFPGPINFTLSLQIDPSSVANVFGQRPSFLPSLTVPVILEPCAAGTFLDVDSGVCIECSSGTYSLVPGSTQCFPCPAHAVCSVSNASAENGYWLYLDRAQGSISSYLCPEGFCVDGQCGANRDINSPLCAQCLPGFYDWGGVCVACDSSHIALLLLMILGFMVYVLIQHVLFQTGGSGHVKIFFLFFQTLQLLAQSTANWMPVFVSVLNLQPGNLTSGSRCLYPASWYTRLASQMASPFALAAFLLCSFLTVRFFRYLRCKCVERSQAGSGLSAKLDARPLQLSVDSQAVLHQGDDEQQPLREPLLSLQTELDDPVSSAGSTHWNQSTAAPTQSRVVGLWTTRALLRSLVAICLLAFQLWVFGVFSYLDCIPVGPYRIMSTTPAIDCDSDSYKQWAALYYVMLPVSFSLPLALAICYWKLRPYLNGQLSNPQPRPERVLYILGVCYEGYRPEVYWFELVLLGQRLIFAVTGTISDLLWPHYPERRLEFLTIELALACILQIRLRPFLSKSSNIFAAVVFATLAVICHVATYYTLTLSSLRYDNGVRTALVVVVMLPSCVLLLLAFLYIIHTSATFFVTLPAPLRFLDRLVSRCLGRFLDDDREFFGKDAVADTTATNAEAGHVSQASDPRVDYVASRDADAVGH